MASNENSIAKSSGESIQSLLEDIQNGKLVLPEMQRGYVWDKERIISFLDSLYRGYPIGSLMLWKLSDGNDGVASRQRDFAVEIDQPGSGMAERMLLDGQQRLTSLMRVLEGKDLKVKGRVRPLKVFFNLDHDKDSQDDGAETDLPDSLSQRKKIFSIGRDKDFQNSPHWIPLKTALNPDAAMEYIDDSLPISDSNSRRRYYKKIFDLDKLRKTEFSCIVLDSGLSYEEVTEIFIRVNSGG
ncbi:DUF262 domain-containing protein [Corynebacterium poyangense]|nr:DUF262 domain-containing protein [Corynebacterium poyangense]